MGIPAFRRKPQGPQAVAGVLALVLAMLLAQALGFAHRVLHHPDAAGQGGHGAVLQVASAQGVAAVIAPVDGQGHGHGADLFQHDDQAPDCRIFDHAGSVDGLGCVPAIALPMALSSFVLLYFQGEVLARKAALFDARGPPSAR